MPNPVKSGVVTSWSPNAEWVRDHRPECVAAIGLVVLGWSRVEDALNEMSAAVLGPSIEMGEGAWGTTRNWIMAAAIRETETIRQRIKVIDAVFRPLVAGHNLQGRWEALTGMLNRRARERNIVAHSGWSWSEQLPDHVIATMRDGITYSWNEKDFLDVFARIRGTEAEIYYFQQAMIEATQAKELPGYQLITERR